MLDGVTGLELGGIFIDVKVGDRRDIWIGFVNVLRHQKIMQSRQLSHSYSSVSGATRIASLASAPLSAPEVFLSPAYDCLSHLFKHIIKQSPCRFTSESHRNVGFELTHRLARSPPSFISLLSMILKPTWC